MNFETLKLENQNSIWTLTIQRPESLNALNSKVLQELSEALSWISEKNFQEAKCLIVTGSGEKAFVAGADIKEISQLGLDLSRKFAEKGQAVFRKLENLQIPVIAAVNGFALGGGLELALACDFIYASENAKFGLPEVTLGLIPGFGGTVRLTRVLGLPKAKEWIFTGQMVSASDAFEMGLVNQVLPQAELLPAVKKVAETIATRGPVAVGAAKQSIMTAYDHDIDSAMAVEAAAFAQLFTTKDVKEGTSAFIEKRKAQFQGL
ncbi:MAG: enoyl-CoA hydratase/isomerase family protein [Pseudobdellovibrionaceae bacterium]